MFNPLTIDGLFVVLIRLWENELVGTRQTFAEFKVYHFLLTDLAAMA